MLRYKQGWYRKPWGRIYAILVPVRGRLESSVTDSSRISFSSIPSINKGLGEALKDGEMVVAETRPHANGINTGQAVIRPQIDPPSFCFCDQWRRIIILQFSISLRQFVDWGERVLLWWLRGLCRTGFSAHDWVRKSQPRSHRYLGACEVGNLYYYYTFTIHLSWKLVAELQLTLTLTLKLGSKHPRLTLQLSDLNDIRVRIRINLLEPLHPFQHLSQTSHNCQNWRWIILPKFTATDLLLAQNIHWDILLILPNSSPLHPDLQKLIRY